MRLLKSANRRLARSFGKTPARWHSESPVVSISFDDFPSSAYSNAGKILEDNQARGTYFLSTELINTKYEGVQQCSEKEVEQLVANGHELAAHTHSHVRLQNIDLTAVRSELQDNVARINSAFAVEPSSFAYPFGDVSPSIKQIVRERFSIGRAITPGLNAGIVDAMHINAFAFYGSSYSRRDLDLLLDATIEQKAWLVFYTHDVCDDHSPYGCSATQFSSLVRRIRERGVDIQPIASVTKSALSPI